MTNLPKMGVLWLAPPKARPNGRSRSIGRAESRCQTALTAGCPQYLLARAVASRGPRQSGKLASLDDLRLYSAHYGRVRMTPGS